MEEPTTSELRDEYVEIIMQEPFTAAHARRSLVVVEELAKRVARTEFKKLFRQHQAKGKRAVKERWKGK